MREPSAAGDPPAYNYRHFSLDNRTMDRLGGVLVGEPAPDFTATRLDGSEAVLSDYRGKPVVLEAGSVTCPMYAGRIMRMNALAQRFPDVTFLVLYVREAHPGERSGPHRNHADKVANAWLAVREDGEGRTILVDDEMGTAHLRYGAMPNTVHIIDQRGVVVFRAMWNDPEAVETVLERMQAGQDPACVTSRFRPADARVLFRVLHRAGRQAMWDFGKSLGSLVWLHRPRFGSRRP